MKPVFKSVKKPAGKSRAKKPARTVTPVVDPDIFVHAAELLCAGKQDYACCAIDSASASAGIDTSDSYATPVLHERYFNSVLKPKDSPRLGPWYGSTYGYEGVMNRFARQIGLLLCAELAREDFRPKEFSP